MKKSLPIYLLLIALPIKTMDNDLNLQLCRAVSHTNPNREQIYSLIAAKADVNYLFASNRSLLHWAASWSYQKSCMILLELGANPNTNAQLIGVHTVNPTPLMAAIDNKLTEVSCLMIKQGADIHVKDSNDRTALWMACDKNIPQVCKLLIEKKADINIQDKIDHHTPLMISTLRWSTPLCKLLLRSGADLRIRSKYAETALIIAAKKNAIEPILAMLNHVLFPSKTEIKTVMYSLFRLRTTNRIASELYRYQAKSLLVPWLLYGIASKNKQACIDLLEMNNTHSKRAAEYYPVSFLNPDRINLTIRSLIQNQLGNIDL
jgi:ankyrin repeat protein